MDKEGFDFYFTPISVWLSHCLFQVQSKGGNPILLREYKKRQETNANEIIEKLDKFNTNKEWAE